MATPHNCGCSLLGAANAIPLGDGWLDSASATVGLEGIATFSRFAVFFVYSMEVSSKIVVTAHLKPGVLRGC